MMPDASDAQRVHPLLRVQSQRRRDTGGGAERAEHRGRMEAGLVHPLRRDEAHPAHNLAADGDAADRIGAREKLALGDREHGRNDDGARMNRAAFERIVVVLAMCGGAVGQRRGRRIEAAGMTDHRAMSGLRRRPHRAHVVRVPRGDAEAGHIHQQRVARCAGARGDRGGAGEGTRQSLRHGDVGHRLQSASMWLARATRVQCAISDSM
jgi:hypothetical protein